MAQRLKHAFDFLAKAFPTPGASLKNRTFVQSVATLACRLVATVSLLAARWGLAYVYGGGQVEWDKGDVEVSNRQVTKRINQVAVEADVSQMRVALRFRGVHASR